MHLLSIQADRGRSQTHDHRLHHSDRYIDDDTVLHRYQLGRFRHSISQSNQAYTGNYRYDDRIRLHFDIDIPEDNLDHILKKTVK